MSHAQATTADEFYGNIWWVPDGKGGLESASLGECAMEIKRLRAGIQAMLDGNYPHPRAYRSCDDGKCPHGTWYYEPCDQCNDNWLTHLLAGGDPIWTAPLPLGANDE